MLEFQLTRSRGAWLYHGCRNGYSFQFQLTRSRGAWLHVFANFNIILYFNSHAHVERDRIFTYFTDIDFISTHTLTWSVTVKILRQQSDVWFQLTRSRGAWPGRLIIINIYKIFQLTRSRGAWLVSLIKLSDLSNFNSHAHVERDGIYAVPHYFRTISTHTLTWSVTIKIVATLQLFCNFNSHAHVERDRWNCW